MHSLWKSVQFFSSWLWSKPSRTRVFASSVVPTSINSGLYSLPLFCIRFYHVSFKNFTLSFNCGFRACNSARACSWLAVSILFVLTASIITLNHCPSSFVFSAITFVCPSSCPMRFLISWLSAVITISPLSGFGQLVLYQPC